MYKSNENRQNEKQILIKFSCYCFVLYGFAPTLTYYFANLLFFLFNNRFWKILYSHFLFPFRSFHFTSISIELLENIFYCALTHHLILLHLMFWPSLFTVLILTVTLFLLIHSCFLSLSFFIERGFCSEAERREIYFYWQSNLNMCKFWQVFGTCEFLTSQPH